MLWCDLGSWKDHVVDFGKQGERRAAEASEGIPEQARLPQSSSGTLMIGVIECDIGIVFNEERAEADIVVSPRSECQ